MSQTIATVYRQAVGKAVRVFDRFAGERVIVYTLTAFHVVVPSGATTLDPHEVERQVQIAADKAAAVLREEFVQEARRAFAELS